MIKDTELKKGNYIFYNPHGRKFIKRIKELREHDLICHSLSDPGQRLALYYTNGDVEPIPITPEWLQRCGGEKTTGTPFYEIDLKQNIGQIAINPDNGMVWLKHHRSEGASINPMSGEKYYLHQLQNLYFALTGKELIIKS